LDKGKKRGKIVITWAVHSECCTVHLRCTLYILWGTPYSSEEKMREKCLPCEKIPIHQFRAKITEMNSINFLTCLWDYYYGRGRGGGAGGDPKIIQ